MISCSSEAERSTDLEPFLSGAMEEVGWTEFEFLLQDPSSSNPKSLGISALRISRESDDASAPGSNLHFPSR